MEVIKLKIKKGVNLLLFRFGNYKKYSFIDEHEKVIHKNKYTWILKSGKMPDSNKMKSIIDDGGWMIIKTPKSVGNHYYITQIQEIITKQPDDKVFPLYYSEFLNDSYNSEGEGMWLKVDSIKEIDSKMAEKLVLSNSGKNVCEVINRTMTSFMFVKTTSEIVF